MKELLPNNILDTADFSLSTQECLDDSRGSLESSSLTTGQIFNSKYLCLCSKTSLEVVNIDNGQRLAAWNFSLDNTIDSISCFCFCGNKIVVALKCQHSKGRLCIFDPGISRITKIINIDFIPTSITIVKEFGGAGTGVLPSPLLKCFFGVAAVGSLNGHILLIDLRLDDLENLTSCGANIQVVDIADDPDMFQLREEFKDTGMHCAIDLNSSVCSYSEFRYVNHNGKLLKLFAQGTMHVSSLQFIQNISSLLVGYSFGCFQIWSLDGLYLLHSSKLGVYTAPITHFIFQEPDDDPHNCCYIWVGGGPSNSDVETKQHAAQLTLYQLLYEEKQYKDGYGNYYKNLASIMDAFSHRLTSDVHHLVDSRSVGSRIIAFKNFEGNSNTSLCYVVWECSSTDGSLSCHLGIFDINRWYQKQLPKSIRNAMYGRMEAVCPFFAFYSLTDVVESFLPNALLDVVVNKKSINSFRASAGTQNDQFYWPSASSFHLSCAFESGKVTSEILGIQRQIVAEMRKIGTDSFLDSDNLVQSCWISGLLQNAFDITRPNTEKKQTDAVLTVNFEHGGVGFIINCIRKWSHGSITHAGHSLKLIFDWAWAQVVQRKRLLDQLHISLFSSLTKSMDDDQHNQLRSLACDMKHLHDVFKEIQRSDALTDDTGIVEIDARLLITDHMNKYSNWLLVLIDIGFLPECSQSSLNNSNSNFDLVYPNELMDGFYKTQRAGREVKNESKLLVDILLNDVMEQANDNLSSKDVSLQCYPPTSVEELCDLFLQVPSKDKLHLKLVYYWMLDVCECYETIKEKKVPDQLQHLFSLLDDDVIFTKSIWLLDHSLKKECIDHISKLNTTFPPLYLTHIVKILHENNELALLTNLCSITMSTTNYGVDEVKFLLRVYLQMGLLFNAHELQKHYVNKESEKKEIFEYFLEECKENKLLGKLITLSLTPNEEIILRSYLQSTSAHGEYYLVYLLERGMYLQASRLTKQLESRAAISLEQGVQDHVLTRRLIVDGFVTTLPSIQQKVMSLSESKSKHRFLSPLSTILKSREDELLQASFVHTALQTSEELIHEKEEVSKRILGNLFSNPRRRKAPLFHGEIVSSPTKKPKEMPRTPTALHRTPTVNVARNTKLRRKSSYSGSDAYLLLRTPRMTRQVNFTKAVEVNIKTPQSILKSRNVSRLQGVSFAAPKPTPKPLLAEDTPSRKIRFAGLSPASPLSPAFTQQQSPLVKILQELESPDESLDTSIRSFTTKEMLEECLPGGMNDSNVSNEVSFDNDTSFDEQKVVRHLDEKFTNEQSAREENVTNHEENQEMHVKNAVHPSVENAVDISISSESEDEAKDEIEDESMLYLSVEEHNQVEVANKVVSMECDGNDDEIQVIDSDEEDSDGNDEANQETSGNHVNNNIQESESNDNEPAVEEDHSENNEDEMFHIGKDDTNNKENTNDIQEQKVVRFGEEDTCSNDDAELDYNDSNASDIDIYDNITTDVAKENSNDDIKGNVDINNEAITPSDTEQHNSSSSDVECISSSSSGEGKSDSDSEYYDEEDQTSDDEEVVLVNDSSTTERTEYEVVSINDSTTTATTENEEVLIGDDDLSHSNDERAIESEDQASDIKQHVTATMPSNVQFTESKDVMTTVEHDQSDDIQSKDIVYTDNTMFVQPVQSGDDKDIPVHQVQSDDVENTPPLLPIQTDNVADVDETNELNDDVDIYSFDDDNYNVQTSARESEAILIDESLPTMDNKDGDDNSMYVQSQQEFRAGNKTPSLGNNREFRNSNESLVEQIVNDSDGSNDIAVKDSDGSNDIGVKDSDSSNDMGVKDSDGSNDMGVKDSDGSNDMGVNDSDGSNAMGVNGNTVNNSNLQNYSVTANDIVIQNETSVVNSMIGKEEEMEIELPHYNENRKVEGVGINESKTSNTSKGSKNTLLPSPSAVNITTIEENNRHLRSHVVLQRMDYESIETSHQVIEENEGIIKLSSDVQVKLPVSPLDEKDIYPSLFEEVSTNDIVINEVSTNDAVINEVSSNDTVINDTEHVNTRTDNNIKVNDETEASLSGDEIKTPQRRSARVTRTRSAAKLSSKIKISDNIESVKRDLNTGNKMVIRNLQPESPVRNKPENKNNRKSIEKLNESLSQEKRRPGRPRGSSKGASPARKSNETLTTDQKLVGKSVSAKKVNKTKISENVESVKRDLNNANKLLISNLKAVSPVKPEIEDNGSSKGIGNMNNSSQESSPGRTRRSTKSAPTGALDKTVNVDTESPDEKPPSKSASDSPARHTRSKQRLSLANTPKRSVITEAEENAIEIGRQLLVERQSRKEDNNSNISVMDPLLVVTSVTVSPTTPGERPSDQSEDLTKVSSRRRTLHTPKPEETLKSIVNTRSKSKRNINADESIVEEESRSMTRRRRTIDVVKNNHSQEFSAPPRVKRKTEQPDDSKMVTPHESILSFPDQVESSPSRLSKRASSRRASLAITTLSPARRSSRMKKTKEN